MNVYYHNVFLRHSLLGLPMMEIKMIFTPFVLGFQLLSAFNDFSEVFGIHLTISGPLYQSFHLFLRIT